MKKSKKTRVTKSKKNAWFTPKRGSYLPNSWQGGLLYLAFAAYLLFALIYGWNETSSTGQAILFIVPNFASAAVLITWIAKRTS